MYFYGDGTGFFPWFPESAELIIKNIYIAQTNKHPRCRKGGYCACWLAFPPFTLPHFQIRDWNKKRGFSLFVLFWERGGVLWFWGFYVILFVCFSFLLLLLPCPFCRPAASLQVAAALSQSVQEEADQGATWGGGLAVPLHSRHRAGTPGVRSLRCQLWFSG